jgi:hypothetical protein
MNGKILFLITGPLLIIFQSFRCRKDDINSCNSYKQDSVVLNFSVENPNSTYHINDTIWISSIISDGVTPISGSGPFTYSFLQLYLNVQPFEVVTNSTLPQLQYANIEFNPVVKQGLLENNAYQGYEFLYRRTEGLNTAEVGFIAGRTGLFALSCSNSSYIGGFELNFAKPNDYCTTYSGISAFPLTQQNINYWDTLGVTVVSLTPNYGSLFIAKEMKNYFFFRVIP